MQRGAAFELPTWAHLTSGSGSSSSRGWPTLLAADARRTSSGPRRQGGQSLADAVRLWATPRASDTRSGRVSEAIFTKNSRPLAEQVEYGTAPGERLNPEWLEALMGFPVGWTAAGAGTA